MQASSSTATHVKQYKSYFTPTEVERLSAKQRGKLSVSREERARQQACGFLDAVGVRCGFPRRTIATAQTLYMRFHLFFPYKDFNYMEVALSCLYVSSKLHDTLKKPRDIILASFPLRFPHLIRKGTIDLAAAQAHGLDNERTRVLGIERLVLESIAFKFWADDGLRVVIKIGKHLGLSKDVCRDSWRVAVDCYRTPAPLSYPPHIIALGSIYTAALLVLESPSLEIQTPENNERSPAWVVQMFGHPGEWESRLVANVGHIDEVAHYLIDLYHTIFSNPENQNLATPSPVSPKEPIPSVIQPSLNPISPPTAFSLPRFWTSQTLTELKIKLRERRGASATLPDWVHEEGDGELERVADGMGVNDATVRFVWDENFAN
ncbi:hypothetical protein L204_100850 [Cryptococcus depauperatus]|nr:CTD kinase subunit beta [Cryptococcus depauperatus CBS 7855]